MGVTEHLEQTRPKTLTPTVQWNLPSHDDHVMWKFHHMKITYGEHYVHAQSHHMAVMCSKMSSHANHML